jgi:hypothetical protein
MKLPDFRKKGRGYLKDRLNNLERVRTEVPKICVQTNQFKKGYKLRSNLVKDGNGLLADSIVF